MGETGTTGKNKDKRCFRQIIAKGTTNFSLIPGASITKETWVLFFKNKFKLTHSCLPKKILSAKSQADHYITSETQVRSYIFLIA